MGPFSSFSLQRSARLLLLLSSYPLVVFSNKYYAKICELQSPLVSLEFDPVSGVFSATPSEDIEVTNTGGSRLLAQTPQTPGRARERIVQVGAPYGRKSFLRGGIIDRLLDSNPSNLFDDTSAEFTASKPTFMARSCPCDTSGRTYCLIDSVSMAVPDFCGVPWSDNISIILQTSNNISESMLYNTLDIGCFELSSQTVFTRNAWPLVILWYGALAIFLLFTSNGKFARAFIINLACPRLRINDAHVERTLAQENEIRRRLRVAAMRTANFQTPERLAYLIRTQVPIIGAWRRSGTTEEEIRQEAARWWIAQAEQLAIPRSVNAHQQVEYVLKTRPFNTARERARRSQMRRLRVESTAARDEDEINDSSLSVTPTKDAISREGSKPSTPETVATTSSGRDDNHPTLVDPRDAASEIERLSSDEASQNTCTISPMDEDSFECTICLTEIEDGELVGVLPCTHIYHVDCLKQWISRKNACPLCQITEIASPRPVALELGGGGNSFPDAPPSEEIDSPGNETHHNLQANAQNNTSHNSANWLARTFLRPASNTSTMIEAELRSYQGQRRRRRQRQAGPIQFW